MPSAKNYWNNKHPKAPVVYAGRGLKTDTKRIEIDVRRMVWADDVILQKFVAKRRLRRKTDDQTALACQRQVVRMLTYTGDLKTSHMNEFWQFPNETIVSHTGDCEDGAILMASLMLNAGIAPWRVRVAAGLVQAGKAAETGGHAYVTYCRESDNNWVVLDWCYLEDSRVPIAKKPILNERPRYKEVWFSFNHLYSWSHKKFTRVEHL